jgi:hypothetical protein
MYNDTSAGQTVQNMFSLLQNKLHLTLDDIPLQECDYVIIVYLSI